MSPSVASASTSPRTVAAAAARTGARSGTRAARFWINTTVEAQMVAASGADREFLEAKLATARFYLEHLLPQAGALAQTVTKGAASTLAMDPADY